ncbi:hypothetical protein N8T08_006881 [Aspergillus melleus]|uniref:Uncharacterized protein n=1 Tax=Aspergillus melleus TaxID=138277 RepID=A0ACC3AZ69_9EURO|nr:hypothetical protein N8T08_006881 [Aspergillus melleus]
MPASWAASQKRSRHRSVSVDPAREQMSTRHISGGSDRQLQENPTEEHISPRWPWLDERMMQVHPNGRQEQGVSNIRDGIPIASPDTGENMEQCQTPETVTNENYPGDQMGKRWSIRAFSIENPASWSRRLRLRGRAYFGQLHNIW